MLSLPVAHPHRRKARQITRSGSAMGSLNWHRIASFPLPPITGSFPDPCYASRKVSRSLSISVTTPTRRSSCTGMGRPYRSTWTERQKKERRLSRRVACAGLRLHRDRLDCGSITRISRAVPICPAGNTCLLYTSDAADDLLCVDLG